ncbi:MAG: hypothetical protein AAFY78_00645 [Cyanobacteria bacterium J06648_16]
MITQLQAGNLLGDQVQGTGYAVFKVRIRNSDIKKGKRAGYRLIYYLIASDRIILLTIYSKTDQTDINAKEIRAILDEL